jgi:hypothetical protein
MIGSRVRKIGLVLAAGAALAASGCSSKATQQEFVGSYPDWRNMVKDNPSTSSGDEVEPPIDDKGGKTDIDGEVRNAGDPHEAEDANKPPPADAGEDPATYGGYVDQIKQVMPGTSGGAAAAIRIENLTTGSRTSYIFKTSGNFDAFADGAFYIAILNRNDDDLYLRIPKLKPGHYECPDFDLLMASTDKSLDDPEAAQAGNPGGSCSIDIWQGNDANDLQGNFTGRLMFNNGQFSYTIESGYFYARDALSHAFKPTPAKPNPPPTGTNNPTGPGTGPKYHR